MQPEQIIGVLYPLVLAILHEDEWGENKLSGDIDLLLELVAAYCLGEVEIQLQKPIRAATNIESDPK